MRTVKKNIISYMLVCISIVFLMGICLKNGETKLMYTGILFSLQSDYGVEDVERLQKDNVEFSNIEKIYEYDGNTYFKADIGYRGSKDKVLKEIEGSDIFSVVEYDENLYTDAIPSERTDKYMSGQWYLDNTGAKGAWQSVSGEPGEDITVAVIDTGVDYTHEDLKRSMWINEKEYLGRSGRDDDGNGFVDDIYGANIVDKNGNPMDNDESGHGTHVAGVIAMTANNGSCVGIAYGAKIMAIKAGNSEGAFKVSDIITAIDYAVKKNADVINMSFGAYIDSTVFEDILKKASEKCILVAAAGNEFKPDTESGEADAVTAYPAGYPFVIGVMAHDENNNLTNWSNYDAEPYSLIEYELAAPGHNILSTVPGNKYAVMSGTSMAAPMVSAAAAILLGETKDKEIEKPLKYVFGQLTQASNTSATKTTMTGKTYRYKALNIQDSLESEEQVNLQIGNIRFCNTEDSKIFKNSYTYDTTVENNRIDKEITCGFVVNNTWSEATDIKVEVSSTSKDIAFTNSDLDIPRMGRCEQLNIDCATVDSFRFIFSGEINNTYTIPLTFKITGKKQSDSSKISSVIIEKVITISVSEKMPEVTLVPQSGVDLSTAPTIPKVVTKGRYIKVSWDNLLKAEGYYVYRSTKKNKGYKKIANVKAASGLRYNDKKAKPGIRYYYKIKAYYKSSEVSGDSKPAYGIRLKKMSKVKIKHAYVSGKNKVTLSWKKIKGADKYEIYYSKKKNGRYKKLKVTAKTKYIHNLRKNINYYYKVRAYAKTTLKKVRNSYSKVVR